MLVRVPFGAVDSQAMSSVTAEPLVTVLAGDRVLDAFGDGALNEDLRAHAGADTSICAVLVAVEDVSSAEANTGKKAVGILQVV